MPTPGAVKQLSIKVTGGSVTEGVYVRATNGRTGDYLIKQTKKDGSAVFPLMDLSDDGTPTGTKSGVQVGDVIHYQVQGDAYGGGSYSVTSAGGKQVTLSVTDRSSTNTVGVSI